MVTINDISKSYGDVKVLSDLSSTFNNGEIIGLLGINGAGKSTLMKILAGVIHPDEGHINIFGKDLEKEPLSAKKKTGYLSEDNPLYNDMYVLEYLEYVARIFNVGKDHVMEMIEKTGLQNEYKKKIGGLSRGNRQRVGIAQAMLHNPRFLILDEAPSGLDPIQRDSVNRLIMEQHKNRITLLSTHILQDVHEICTRFIIIHKGKIVSDLLTESVESVGKIFFELTK